MQIPPQLSLDFEAAFSAIDVRHRPPLKWQTRLYKRFVRGGGGDVPGACRLPTGLGKTSVIPIWLIALCGGAGGVRLPRRLVYIVNRRTVVDQATDDAKRLLARLYRSGQRDGLAWATEEAIKKLGLESEPSLPCDHAPATKHLRLALDALCTGDPTTSCEAAPLAVSTLRGELADNGEWKKNPARPAIIIGTIDMIGSKLLFSGYGDGRYGRAHHAGLIGQDALVVHDEAHLEPAFDVLLRGVAAEQARCGESRPIRVMSLSATTREGGAVSSGGTDAGCAFGIEPEDRLDPVVLQRINARKSLTIVDADRGKCADTIAKEALHLGASPSRVLVYVRSPDDVAKIAEAIRKALGGGARVATLTGTIRGKERDELPESELFLAFKASSDRSSALHHALYLISTSAGEVGADLDADHLVCDLTTLDSMAQRLGRVNRLGGKNHDGNERSAQIVVVVEAADTKGKKATSEGGTEESESPDDGESSQKAKTGKAKGSNEYETAVLKTGEILRGLAAQGGDVSPAGLGAVTDGLSVEDKQAAFSPVPKILPATDILFDHWSLTSIGWAKGPDSRWRDALPGRPAVEPYLHGVAEWNPPETYVAWRAEIALLATAGGKDQHREDTPCSHDELESVFDVFPLHSTEQLRDRTDRVQGELRKIAKRLNEKAQHRAASPPADKADPEESNNTIHDAEGEITKGKDKPIEPNPWVVLMRGGSMEWVRLEDLAPVDNDDAKRAQRRLSFATVVLPVEVGGLKNGMLQGDEPTPADARSLDVAEVVRGGAQLRQRLLEGRPLLGGDAIAGVARATISLAREGEEDAEPVTLEYLVAKGQDREPGERVLLDEHNAAVGAAAEGMAEALGLSDFKRAFTLAGRLHDLGKARVVWQRFASNWDETARKLRDGALIAKSKRYGTWKQLAGYRHEFGSLHDVLTTDDVRALDPDTRDLVLHLIAAHHGWARPHFEPRHFDPGDPSPGKPRRTADNERLAVETMQRFARLQQRYGRWGLAWLESILRCADAAASESGSVAPPVAASASDAGWAERDSKGASNTGGAA